MFLYFNFFNIKTNICVYIKNENTFGIFNTFQIPKNNLEVIFKYLFLVFVILYYSNIFYLNTLRIKYFNTYLNMFNTTCL